MSTICQPNVNQISGNSYPTVHIQLPYSSGHAQQEIAEAVNLPQQTVYDSLPKMTDLEKSVKISADFADPEFDTPLYNVWA